MHLKINGTSIPTHGKLEVDIYLDRVGEQLPEGAVIRIHDGILKLHGRPEGPGLRIVADHTIEIFERHGNPAIAFHAKNGIPDGCGITVHRCFPRDWYPLENTE